MTEWALAHPYLFTLLAFLILLALVDIFKRKS